MFGMKQVSNDNGITAKVRSAQQQQAPAGDEEQSNVTPEEQQAKDMVVNNALELIYTDSNEVEPTIMSTLRGQISPDLQQVFAAVEPPLQSSPVDNLAAMALILTVNLDLSAEEAGKPIADEILYHAGAEIVEELANIAETGNIHNYSEEEIEGAFYRALDMFRVISPRVDADMLGEEFAIVANADKAGNLPQVVPGIEQRLAA